jgi:hypothetical protein
MHADEHEFPLVIDPTENLTEQLTIADALVADALVADALVADALVADAPGEAVEQHARAQRLARLVLELHDWLAHGGSFPDQWQGVPGGDIDDVGDDDDRDDGPTVADVDGRFSAGTDNDA